MKIPKWLILFILCILASAFCVKHVKGEEFQQKQFIVVGATEDSKVVIHVDMTMPTEKMYQNYLPMLTAVYQALSTQYPRESILLKVVEE